MITMITIFTLSKAFCAAQHNVYGIDNGLYKYFLTCYNNMNNRKGLKMADTLLYLSKKKNDIKAQCLAHYIKVGCSSNVCSDREQQRIFNEAKTFFIKTKNTLYVFQSWNILISEYENRNRFDKALNMMEEFERTAIQTGDEFGKLMVFYNYGSIYYKMNLYKTALEKFQQAANYQMTHKSNGKQDYLYNIYYSMSLCEAAMGNMEMNFKYLKMSLKAAKFDIYKIKAIQNLTYFELLTGNNKDGMKHLAQLNKLMEKYGTNAFDEYYYALMALLAYKDNNFNKALAYSDSITEEGLQLKVKADLYEHSGKLKSTIQILRKLIKRKQEMEQAGLAQYTSVLAEKYDKERAEKEKNKILFHYKLYSAISIAVLISVLFIMYYVLHRRNLTMLKKEKDIANQARIAAEQADKMKTTFLQNMSHEIRTPLNAIVGFTDIISSQDVKLSAKEKDEMLHIIHYNSDVLTTLINDILKVARLESGNEKLTLEKCNVYNLCNMLLQAILVRLPDGVKVSVNIPQDEMYRHFELVTDKTRLSTILVNFLTNACKHTKTGEIKLGYKIEKEKVIFSVTDTGIGIPQEYAQKIFQRFEKLDEFVQGTGLGLNICLRTAQLLGGKVYVDTSYTNGAKFILEHPINLEATAL